MSGSIKKYIVSLIIASMLLNTATPIISIAGAEPVYDEEYMHRQAERLRAEQGITFEGDVDLEETPAVTFDERAAPPYPVSPASRIQRTIAEQHTRRLIQIQAYRSAPTIPWMPWQFAGLRLTGESPSEKDYIDETSVPESPWDRLLDEQHKAETAKIMAVINSGTVIPALLISGLNSDLPGHIVAQVSENVFDSPTGKRLLIPQGSRLFGDYDSKVIFGQKRPLVKWTRLIYPDGSTLNLENMPGGDRSGYAGFKASVDSHFGPMLGSALLVSLFAGLADSFDDQKQTITLNQPQITLPDYVPVGTVVAWSSPEAPEGWLLCDGQKFDTAIYPELEEALSSDHVPNYIEAEDSDIGTIVAIPGLKAPYGYLECNGDAFEAKQYPLLAAYLGTNRLPDYRGLFLRGANHGRSDGKGDTDPWRTVGTYQTDIAGAHTHVGTAAVSGQFTGTGTSTGSGYATLSGSVTGVGFGTMTGTAQTTGYATLTGTTQGTGIGIMDGTVFTSGYATLSGTTNATGFGVMTGTAQTAGNATLTGTTKGSGYGTMTGTSTGSGYANLTGTSTGSGYASLSGTAETTGFGSFTGTSSGTGYAALSGIVYGSGTTGSASLYSITGNQYIYQPTTGSWRWSLGQFNRKSISQGIDTSITTDVTVFRSNYRTDYGSGDSQRDTDDPAWLAFTKIQVPNAASLQTHSHNVSVSGTANVAGTVNTTGTANVSGEVKGSGSANVSGPIETTGTAKVSGQVETSGTAKVSGQIETTGTATVSGPIETSGTAEVSGQIDVTGTATVSGPIETSGHVQVSGQIDSTGTATVSGPIETSGTAEVSGQVDVTGTATVSGPIEVNGPVKVVGFGEFTGPVVISPDQSTGEETRPRNIAVTYAIKAHGADKKYWIIKAAPTGVSPYERAAIAGLLGTSAEVVDQKGNPFAKELAESLSDMADKLLEKWIEVAPTLTVKPGYRFSVIVNKEIALPVKTRFR